MFNKVKLKKYLIGMFAAIILMSAAIVAVALSLGLLGEKGSKLQLTRKQKGAQQK